MMIMSKTIVSYKDRVHSTTHVSSMISICDKKIKDLQDKLEKKIIERYRLNSLLEELDRIREED